MSVLLGTLLENRNNPRNKYHKQAYLLRRDDGVKCCDKQLTCSTNGPLSQAEHWEQWTGQYESGHFERECSITSCSLAVLR